MAKSLNQQVSQTERPGPGDYEIAKADPRSFAQPSSVFASRVQRTGIGSSQSNTGLRSNTALSGTGYKGYGIKSMVYGTGRPGTTGLQLQNGSLNINGQLNTQQDVDIFEDDDLLDNPGPGAYYNASKNTCFKTGKIPERLQYFGSKVERFNLNNKDSDKNPVNNVGPGSYQIPNMMNKS